MLPVWRAHIIIDKESRDEDESENDAEIGLRLEQGLAFRLAHDAQHEETRAEPRKEERRLVAQGLEQLHRSTSPNTMSCAPRMAETSASRWPRLSMSIACRCAKPGARILHL